MLEATSDMKWFFYNMSGPVPSFTARRSYRPRVMFAGLGVMLGFGALAVVLALADRTDLAPYVAGAGALAYFISTIAAMIPQQVTIEIAGKTVTPSWRGAIEVDRVELGYWVVPGIDAASGLAVTIRGKGGALRIGGDKHDGEGYELGAPTRTVDCHLRADELDALVQLLGITRGEPGPLAIPLIRSSQSIVGIARGMAPWLITITVLGVLGIVVGNTAWGQDMLATPDGQLVMALVCGGVALFGVVWMIVRSRRVRGAELELREEDDALIVDDGKAPQRVPWKSIAIEKLTYSVSSRMGTFSMPLLVLTIGDRKLRLGAWDTQLAWPGQPAKTWRAPHWLVGAAKWPKLLDLLKRHGRS